MLEAVRRAAAELVIVDMARPDRDSLESVRDMNQATPLPVVMFVDEDDPAFMEDAIAAGVISYHVTGAALPEVKPILRTAMAFFRRNSALAVELDAMRSQLAARGVIDQAKRLLMAQDGMSEPAAHRFLQRRAMDQQKKLSDIAQTLLNDRTRSESKKT
jgi:response regulator NasT